MSDRNSVPLKAIALVLILVGAIALPLVRGFQTGFATTADVVTGVSQPAPHVTTKPAKTPEGGKHKPGKPAKPQRNHHHDSNNDEDD
jgi:hypothetical protein